MGRAQGENEGRNGQHDPTAQVLHELSNTLHALSLRLLAIGNSGLPAPPLEHLQSARHLVEQSSSLVARLRALREGPSPPPPRTALTRGRNPR
jgi:hypothetical protein